MVNPIWSRSSSAPRRCRSLEHAQAACTETAGGCCPAPGVGLHRSPAARCSQAVSSPRWQRHDRSFSQGPRHLPGALAEDRSRHRNHRRGTSRNGRMKDEGGREGERGEDRRGNAKQGGEERERGRERGRERTGRERTCKAGREEEGERGHAGEREDMQSRTRGLARVLGLAHRVGFTQSCSRPEREFSIERSLRSCSRRWITQSGGVGRRLGLDADWSVTGRRPTQETGPWGSTRLWEDTPSERDFGPRFSRPDSRPGWPGGARRIASPSLAIAPASPRRTGPASGHRGA
jgi:hypothetical protein